MQIYLTKINIILQNLKHPVSVPQLNLPQKVPQWKSVHKITPRRNTLGFLTSPTILHNLFHPTKNTASLIIPSEVLNFIRWVLILPFWYHWYSLVCGKTSMESQQCEVTLLPEFEVITWNKDYANSNLLDFVYSKKITH